MKNKALLFLSIGLLLGGILIAILWGFAQQQSSQVRVLRLPHTMPSDHPVHLAMEKMAQQVKEQTKGRIIIQIYPNGLLGDGSQIRELMQLGVVDIGKFSACDFEDNIPEMAAFCLPFAFTDADHYWRVLNSPLGEKILNAGYETQAALKGLCYYDAGARSFYSNKPIDTEEKLKNKKVRVMVSALMISGVEAMGAVPTSMAWGELFTALQTGTVDAAENNIPSFFTSKHYEVCKYFVFSEHFRTPDILAMNRHVWDQLSSEDQQILLNCAKDSVIYQRALWDKASEQYVTQMKSSGVHFSSFNQEHLKKRVQPLFEKLYQESLTNSRKKIIMATYDAIQKYRLPKDKEHE